jgi:two-component system sensor kinase FixL
VGGNLREVCRRAGTEASLSPYVALDGVEAVLRGDAQEFRLKYDWEAPTGHRYVEMVAAPLVRPEGGAVISHIDLTDRERAARELQDLRQTVAHSGRIMSLGEMSASLAHELNQPLTAILSNVQAAKRFLATRPHNLAEIHEILADIEEDNQRAGEIIRRLRTMIRKGHTDRQQLLLNDHVQEVADLISADARLRHIAVVLDLDPGLSQVILNLTLNGADAMETTIPEERELLLRTWRYNNESVALSVRDRGAGITAKPVDQIFEPYYSSKREGLGLGLSIARSIVEAHGGWIRAANNPDRGATLLLVLPIDGEKTQ